MRQSACLCLRRMRRQCAFKRSAAPIAAALAAPLARRRTIVGGGAGARRRGQAGRLCLSVNALRTHPAAS
jgi:hypothetical protein